MHVQTHTAKRGAKAPFFMAYLAIDIRLYQKYPLQKLGEFYPTTSNTVRKNNTLSP